VLREDEELEVIREQKAQMAAKQEEMAMLQAGGQVVEQGSKVDLNLAKAQKESKE